ncbi:hypothetical protein NMG46_28160 [Mesorhizobium sp. LMG 17147]|uniref:hypothetical protein n=1 Tax=Mesorhizobium sp. LMG 17147 TaxID=2963091 RepID=UPI0020C95DC2|nr:hypothetical protein [Mesorhizobium sp. LMG 17147]MCP9234037.1 hypothetical protein [Mesorhizobium sp. LMG 17147]
MQDTPAADWFGNEFSVQQAHSGNFGSATTSALERQENIAWAVETLHVVFETLAASAPFDLEGKVRFLFGLGEAVQLAAETSRSSGCERGRNDSGLAGLS